MTCSYLLGEAAFCHRKHKPNSPRPPPLMASSIEQKAHRDPYQLGAGRVGNLLASSLPYTSWERLFYPLKLGSSSSGGFSLMLPWQGCWTKPSFMMHLFQKPLGDCSVGVPALPCSAALTVSLEGNIGAVLPGLLDLCEPLFRLFDHLSICGAFKAAAGDWGLAQAQRLA